MKKHRTRDGFYAFLPEVKYPYWNTRQYLLRKRLFLIMMRREHFFQEVQVIGFI